MIEPRFLFFKDIGEWFKWTCYGCP